MENCDHDFVIKFGQYYCQNCGINRDDNLNKVSDQDLNKAADEMRKAIDEFEKKVKRITKKNDQ